MNDRTLLEKAAKAANYPVEFDGEVNGYFPNGRDENGDVAEWWNPLTDDGDCARLESACDLNVRRGKEFVAVFCDDREVFVKEYYADHGGDKNAARRRASTRAAAELENGK